MRFLTSAFCVISIVCLIGNPVYSQQNSWTNENILVFNSEPEGASVILDNEYKGKTPLEIKHLPKGKYTVTVKMEGYMDKTYYVEMTGSKVEKYVIMSGDYALLNLTSEPSGADFYFNDIKMGQTPVINFRMPLGKQNITLKKDEYKDAGTSLQVVSFKYDLHKELEPTYSIFRFDKGNKLSLFLDDKETDIESDSVKILFGEHNFKIIENGNNKQIEKDFSVDPSKIYSIRVLANQYRTKYIYQSAYLPGLGQIKDDSEIKGWAFMGSFFAAGGYAVYNIFQRQNSMDEYDNNLKAYEEAKTEIAAKDYSIKLQQSADNANSYRSKIYIGFGVMGGIYAINLLDAIFNHSIGPDIDIKPINEINSKGVNIRWRIN